MILLLRPDFRIRINGNQIMLVNCNFANQEYKLDSLSAFFLALHDGAKSCEDIKEVFSYLFEERQESLETYISSAYMMYRPFLISLHKAEALFPKPWQSYCLEDILSAQAQRGSNDIRLPAPRYICFYLTHKCTQRCLYCFAKAEHVELEKEIETDRLSFDEISKIIHESFLLGVDGFLLTGGEPLIHPDIYSIISLLNAYDIDVQILTKHRVDVDKIKDLDFSRLSIGFSIDSHIEETAEYITSTPTYYSDIMKNIDDFNQNSLQFNIHMVASKVNVYSIRESVQFYLDKGAQTVFINFYENGTSDAINQALQITDAEKDIVRAVVEEIKSLPEFANRVILEDFDIELTIEQVKKSSCSTGTTKLSIRYDGRYVYCEKLADYEPLFIGRAQDSSMIDIWNSEQLKRLVSPEKEKYSKTICGNCQDFSQCLGKNSCYYMSQIQHGHIYKPLKELENVCLKR